MDFVSIISIALYLCTFFFGFQLGRDNLSPKYLKKRIRYVVWLYVFLCFGYMTGSDWRTYEQMFYGGNLITQNAAEFGFWNTFNFLSKIIDDYWIVVGILKAIYLYSFIRLAKIMTNQWPALIAVSLPLSLMYLLIDNPLRYMMAMIFVNFALPFLFKKKYLYFVLISLVGVSFHSTSIIVILLISLSYHFPNKVLDIKPGILAIIYIIFSLLLSGVSYLSEIQTKVNQLSVLYGFKDYDSYTINDNSSFFTIGSILTLFFGLYVIANISIIKQKYSWGPFVAKAALLYIFLQRATLLIPSGYRFLLPLSIFYALFFVIKSSSDFYVLIRMSPIVRKTILIIMTVTLVRSLYQEYVYIPYSNSIPYIIKGHLTFAERDYYNVKAADLRLK